MVNNMKIEVKSVYTFVVNGTTITLTGDQARELYYELQKTFGQTIPQQLFWTNSAATPTPLPDVSNWYGTNSMDCGGYANQQNSVYKTSVYWNSDKTNNQNNVDEIGC